MLAETADRGTVERMVKSFYAMIVKDDLVGPYFLKALGDDLSNDKWYEHYQTLNKFWLMLVEGEPGYTGDPFHPHAFLGELEPETFKRWLELFDIHVRKYFVPDFADKFYKKSEILAEQFMQRLEIGKYAQEEE